MFSVVQVGWCDGSVWKGGGENWVKKDPKLFLFFPLSAGEEAVLRNKKVDV